MPEITIVDVTSEEAFGLVPPCADPSFDHRTCDYWEDAVAGSRARREGWLGARREAGESTAGPAPATNPFAPQTSRRSSNPFAPEPPGRSANPFAPSGTPDAGTNPFAPDASRRPANPFAPAPRLVERPDAGGSRKLVLLARGLGVFGSYARLLLVDGRAVAYCQFGPLSAYPRALQLRELYPQLPSSPLPAVITCIATTPDARRQGQALRLVEDVCGELARRGFAAVETYPETGARADATSAATPAFWERAGFTVAVADDRFPVMRRDL